MQEGKQRGGLHPNQKAKMQNQLSKMMPPGMMNMMQQMGGLNGIQNMMQQMGGAGGMPDMSALQNMMGGLGGGGMPDLSALMGGLGGMPGPSAKGPKPKSKRK